MVHPLCLCNLFVFNLHVCLDSKENILSCQFSTENVHCICQRPRGTKLAMRMRCLLTIRSKSSEKNPSFPTEIEISFAADEVSSN